MASFIVYDLIFLILFGIFAFVVFKKNRSSFKRQGWMFLYHTKFGIELMKSSAKRFGKILRPLSYVVIASGYVLMAGILWLITKTVWTYVTLPIPDQLRNLPPIAPLIPYFPKLFNLESIFPPLYFTYFLVAIAVVTISHEFAHGLFAKLWKIKVKTTGLAFFGPFFGAFVEPDEKKMAKAPKKHQLSILAAGTFANIVMFILFGLILWGFFAFSFAPAGLIFNAYAQGVVNVSQITQVGNSSVFSIASIDGKQILSHDDLTNALSSKKPMDVVAITTIDSEKQIRSYEIELGDKNGNAYLGIGFYAPETKGFRGLMAKWMSNIKNPNVYYTPVWDGDFVQFIYDMLWWVVIINILVALMNMLPVSILDGGRFFYLTIWGITGSAKWAKRIYSFVTWFILLLLVIMMGRWFFNLF